MPRPRILFVQRRVRSQFHRCRDSRCLRVSSSDLRALGMVDGGTTTTGTSSYREHGADSSTVGVVVVHVIVEVLAYTCKGTVECTVLYQDTGVSSRTYRPYEYIVLYHNNSMYHSTPVSMKSANLPVQVPGTGLPVEHCTPYHIG